MLHIARDSGLPNYMYRRTFTEWFATVARVYDE